MNNLREKIKLELLRIIDKCGRNRFDGLLLKVDHDANTFLILDTLKKLSSNLNTKAIIFRNSLSDSADSIRKKIVLTQELGYEFEILEIGDLEGVVSRRLLPYLKYSTSIFLEDFFFTQLSASMNYLGIIPYSLSQILMDPHIYMIYSDYLEYPLICFYQSQLESHVDLSAYDIEKKKLRIDYSSRPITYEEIDRSLREIKDATQKSKNITPKLNVLNSALDRLSDRIIYLMQILDIICRRRYQ